MSLRKSPHILSYPPPYPLSGHRCLKDSHGICYAVTSSVVCSQASYEDSRDSLDLTFFKNTATLQCDSHNGILCRGHCQGQRQRDSHILLQQSPPSAAMILCSSQSDILSPPDDFSSLLSHQSQQLLFYCLSLKLRLPR